MERVYRSSDYYKGDFDLFRKVLNTKGVAIAFDGDGILFNSTKPVFRNCEKLTGVKLNPEDIDRWGYLKETLREKGVEDEMVNQAESAWYDPVVLSQSPRYLYSATIVRHAVRIAPDRVFLLTARNPNLRNVTDASMRRLYPVDPGMRLLIRSDLAENSAVFKANKLIELASLYPWVVLFDDANENVDFALNYRFRINDIEYNMPQNILVGHIPQGRTECNITHPRLVRFGRYPNEIQAMYPLLDNMKRAMQ